MKVSTTQNFQIVYSIYQHEYLGYLFASAVIQVNSKNELTFQYQSISSQNAKEFKKGLDEADFKLIELIEKSNQDYIIKKFYNKKLKHPSDFFFKVYDKKKGNKALQQHITQYLEDRKQEIIALVEAYNKQIFVMGKDGLPTWRKLKFADEAARVLFHFRKNENNTHYFPTIKYKKKRLEFRYKGAFILCNQPAWMVFDSTLYYFAMNVDGKKLKPFLYKNHIAIPEKVEETYYRKFVTQLVAAYDVHAVGFDIVVERHKPRPLLYFSSLQSQSKSLFHSDTEEGLGEDIRFELLFQYGNFKVPAQALEGKVLGEHKAKVELRKESEKYVFYKIKRQNDYEQSIKDFLSGLDLKIPKDTTSLPKVRAFQWLSTNAQKLESKNFQIKQVDAHIKKYFVGRSDIQIEVNEKQDWFDIYAKIRFGVYDIPFLKIRQLILKGKTEFSLPNGEIAVIPEDWIRQYTELFAFAENDESESLKLKKYHLSLIDDLKADTSAKIKINKKLAQFQDFDKIEESSLPKGFKGKLRSYQKAGYDWLKFLNKYNFGGCLADDMGLGKTVQTLALLQGEKERNVKAATLLIMPTSLIYNWQIEAQKFTPELKILVYTGSNRLKSIEHFTYYDIILTSYGIVRVDIDILKKYRYNYVLLDESQAIKNPGSNISKAVRGLRSKHKLILTGTPLENTTLDLWSQMSFVNEGLLGSQAFFKREFVNPIEKKNDTEKLAKLSKMIKPFILRRLKSQVATDLPQKIENVQYCLMTEAQEKIYEEVKSQYRNEVLKEIENQTFKKSKGVLLHGLQKLRQLANHPKLIEESYKDTSGKLEDVLYKLEGLVSENHKVLIFSSFVKYLDLLKVYLEQKQYKYAYLTGQTKDRQGEVRKFQEEEDIQIFLISIKAGGIGLNLTAAEYVFLLDPWWNPAVEAQAVDRAHRIGQKSTVFTYKFITKNTIEEKILQLQASKKGLAENLISTEEDFKKSLTKQDFLDLLK